MAGLYLLTSPPGSVEYSINDGHVRLFILRGEKLYDENDGTAAEGWKLKLIEFVREHGLDSDRDGRGLHFFVRRMLDEGLLG